MLSFHDWLQNCSEEAPAAEKLATLIAQSGGVSRGRLTKAVNLPEETLADLLKALTATRQVTMLRVNGELVYRAAG
jgi:sulfur carrier protein ThiS